jgi:hypothetical protein
MNVIFNERAMYKNDSSADLASIESKAERPEFISLVEFLGLLMYLLTTLTTCAISSFVQTIAYIRLPIAQVQGTLLM